MRCKLPISLALFSFLSSTVSSTMLSRTNTTSQFLFTLPFPSAVTYDVADAGAPSDPKIRVTLPAHSTWSAPLHWHDTHSSHLSFRRGRVHIYTASSLYRTADRFIGPDYDATMVAGLMHTWQRASIHDKDPEADTDDVVVDLDAGSAGEARMQELFYRNMLSAILDAPRYAHLVDTPFWVRLLFSLPLSDAAKARLTAWFLRVQLMVFYAEFDLWPHLGSIPLSGLWSWRPFDGQAPDWAARFEWGSMRFISHGKVRAMALFGRWVLRMKPVYAEYTPERLRMPIKELEVESGDL